MSINTLKYKIGLFIRKLLFWKKTKSRKIVIADMKEKLHKKVIKKRNKTSKKKK